jgi:hypothetical protein
VAGRGGIRGCGGKPARQRRRRKEGGGRKLTGGTQPSARTKKKEKQREGVGWRGERLAGCWAAWAERYGGFAFFFFFSFSNSF